MDNRRSSDFQDKNAPAPWQLGPKLGPFSETPPEPVILNKDILWFVQSYYRWGSMTVRGVGSSGPPAFPLLLCLWLIFFGLLPWTTMLSLLALTGEGIRSKVWIWRNWDVVIPPAERWKYILDYVVDVGIPLVLIGLYFAWDYSRGVPGPRACILNLFPQSFGRWIDYAGTVVMPALWAEAVMFPSSPKVIVLTVILIIFVETLFEYVYEPLMAWYDDSEMDLPLHEIKTVEELISRLPRRAEAPSVCRQWPALVIATILLEIMPDRLALFELVDMTGLGIFLLCLALHVDPIQRPTDGIVVVRNVDIGLVFWYVEDRGARLVAQTEASQLDPDDVWPEVFPDEEDWFDDW